MVFFKYGVEWRHYEPTTIFKLKVYIESMHLLYATHIVAYLAYYCTNDREEREVPKLAIIIRLSDGCLKKIHINKYKLQQRGTGSNTYLSLYLQVIFMK